MDEILKILERHPGWHIEISTRPAHAAGMPRGLELRMWTSVAGTRFTDVQVIPDGERRQSKCDIVTPMLQKMEHRISFEIENATNPPAGDNIRQNP